ncbi:hypothetical protein F511_32373 [Dorcoceras hygrometricum]|uniref:Uncharacterized protein n=1 Tax=Dorcoceras hygrometricum TaxID=472368 RepID=A0A2Z7C6G2_9LAMI|nr:hypothetical protein F511_32373 [Dorcoceras hygrometricum]
MVNQTSEDEVFDFSNTEFTREDLISALNEMVQEYRKLSQKFEEVKAENVDLKNSSVEPRSVQLGKTDSLQIELSKLNTMNEFFWIRSIELKSEIEKLKLIMSSWTQSSVSLDKLCEIQKPANDRTGLGFNSSESNVGETSTQSYLVYDKFKKMSFVKASMTHDTCESVRYDDQNSSKLNQKGKAGIGFLRPENSKPSWLKNRFDKDKAKAGSKSFVSHQPRRSSKKAKSDWRKVEQLLVLSNLSLLFMGKIVESRFDKISDLGDLNFRGNEKSELISAESTEYITLVSGIFSFVILSEMASSLIRNTNQVHFASVLAMDNAGMVAMFESPVASGLNGFLGFASGRIDRYTCGTEGFGFDARTEISFTDVVDKEISTTDDVENIIEQVISETTQFETDVGGKNVGETTFGDQAVQRADEMEHWFNVSYEEFVAREADRMGESGSDTNEEIVTDKVTEIDAGETADGEQTVQRSNEKEKDAESGAISAAEITKIKFGLTVKINEVQDKDWYYASLPQISATNKGKEPLEEVDVVKGNPAREKSQPDTGLRISKRNSRKGKPYVVLAETNSLEVAVKRRVYIIVKYREMLDLWRCRVSCTAT